MAQRFKFGLEKVLEYREMLEDQAMQVMVLARTRFQQQQAKLETMRIQLAEAEMQLSQRLDVTAADLWLWKSYREAAERDIREATRVLQKLAKELQAARQVLVSRAKDRKLLEKLKDKQAERHAREGERAEQKEFDEGAALRYQHADI